MSRLELAQPPRGPLACDTCGRFVAVKDARLSHEYGDYGSILSTEVLCPRCDDREAFYDALGRGAGEERGESK